MGQGCSLRRCLAALDFDGASNLPPSHHAQAGHLKPSSQEQYCQRHCSQTNGSFIAVSVTRSRRCAAVDSLTTCFRRSLDRTVVVAPRYGFTPGAISPVRSFSPVSIHLRRCLGALEYRLSISISRLTRSRLKDSIPVPSVRHRPARNGSCEATGALLRPRLLPAAQLRRSPYPCHRRLGHSLSVSRTPT